MGRKNTLDLLIEIEQDAAKELSIPLLGMLGTKNLNFPKKNEKIFFFFFEFRNRFFFFLNQKIKN